MKSVKYNLTNVMTMPFNTSHHCVDSSNNVFSFGVNDLMGTQFHFTSAADNCIDELIKCTPCLEEYT